MLNRARGADVNAGNGATLRYARERDTRLSWRATSTSGAWSAASATLMLNVRLMSSAGGRLELKR